MRALVLGGAGAMGRWVVRDLTESDGVDEVAVADLDLGRALEAAGWAAARAGAHGTASVRALALDAADGAALRHALEPPASWSGSTRSTSGSAWSTSRRTGLP